MENIIKQIIEIDRKAQQNYAGAEDYRKKAEEEVQKEILQYDKQTEQNCQEKLARVRAEQKELLEERLQTISSELTQKKEALARHYEEKHAEWEDDLFHKIWNG